MIGQTLGHYRILEQIGAGGMGVVYRAHDERLDRDVALKVLPPGTLTDEAARKRFRKEALTLSKLNHPNIETVFDFDTQDSVDFLVMELIPGISLDQKLASGRFSERDVLRLGQQLAEGLAAAHAEGIIHRDLKPGNLRLTPDGRLKILDFGLAKLLQPVSDVALTESLSGTQAVTGTLPYMAPEQLRGEPADARSDIWAAGAVVYELSTGRRPFDARVSTALAGDIQHTPPPAPRQLRPELSPKLEDVILKCLDKDPANRYQSARELAVDLRRLAAPTSTVAVAVDAPVRKGWKTVTAVSLALLVALVAAVAVLNSAGLRERLLGRAAPPQIKSIAVLPLANLSGDPEQEYFADGMTEALITDLAQINALKVISRTSVMQYKGTRKPLPQIGRELGVEAVIEGSVLRVGNRVRITAQLIESATDRHLWAQSYDRDVRDVLALQDQVARAIADQVQAKLTPQEQSRLTSARPVNPEAHELYLKGRYQANKGTVESLWKAVEYFEKAVELDPNDALVYASLADAYGTLGVFGGLPPKEAFPKAKPLVAKALALDDNLASAHQVLASIKRDYEWDWEGAEKEFRRALELNPNSAEAHDMYAVYLLFMRRFEEALREIQHAQSLDPLNLDASNNLGFIAFAMHDDARAIEAYRRTIDLDSSFVMSHRELGLVYSSRGLHPQAISESEKAVSLSRDPYTLAMLGHVYASAGRRQEALRILEELKKRSQHEFVAAYYFADLYAGLREKELTLYWLERAYEERDTALLWTRGDPRFDWLRSDARFQNVMRRMNFPAITSGPEGN